MKQNSEKLSTSAQRSIASVKAADSAKNCLGVTLFSVQIATPGGFIGVMPV